MGAKISHIRSFKGHKGPVYAWDAEYSGGSDGYLVKWDLETGEGLALAKTPDAIFGLCAADSCVFVSTLGGSVFRYAAAEPIQLLLKVDCPIYKVAYCQGVLMAIDQKGRFWESQNSSDWKFTQVHDASLRGLWMEPNALLLSGAQGKVYERGGQEWQGHTDGTQETTYSLVKSGETIITASKDAQLRIWHKENKSWHVKQSIPAHMNAIYAVSLSPNGQWLLSASRDRTFKIWRTEPFELLKVMDATKLDEAHSRSVNNAQWLDDEQFITVSDDGQIKLWRWN
ncbi:MAG: hypothetical protein RL577_314 [Bacteroidota bacterium]